MFTLNTSGHTHTQKISVLTLLSFKRTEQRKKVKTENLRKLSYWECFKEGEAERMYRYREEIGARQRAEAAGRRQRGRRSGKNFPIV